MSVEEAQFQEAAGLPQALRGTSLSSVELVIRLWKADFWQHFRLQIRTGPREQDFWLLGQNTPFPDDSTRCSLLKLPWRAHSTRDMDFWTYPRGILCSLICAQAGNVHRDLGIVRTPHSPASPHVKNKWWKLFGETCVTEFAPFLR